MNPLHLLWIIPLAAGFGAFIMAIFAGGKDSQEDRRDECYYCPFPCERNK